VNINPGDYNTSVPQNRKIVTHSTDIYRSIFKRVLSLYEKDELNGGDPIEIAKLIEKLIKKEGNYKVRYLILLVVMAIIILRWGGIPV